MTVFGANVLSTLIAATAGFGWGALWYVGLSKPWMRAARIDPSATTPSPLPFVISFVGLVVMALVIGLVMAGMARTGIGAGVGTGLLLWLGFVATTIAVNHRYQGFGWDLTAIDSGHWLGVCVIMGAIVGWWG